jgi:type VI secretion system secreted protein VgrG
VTNKTGTQLESGLLDEAATGPRFFSRKATDAQVWVGTTGWDAEEETLLHDGNEEETA